MIEIIINEFSFTVKKDISILEACRYVGIKMPRFCYHESLSIAGNCRMCLVKLESEDKLTISCLTEVSDGVSVITEDPYIQKAREDIVEFLLLNHPLDCPICDQGGECDLQDQVKMHGSHFSRYHYNKAGVEDKTFGIFINTIMTRCINCTRCVRYTAEIGGAESLGVLNRGHFSEIGTYSYQSNKVNAEASGNVIDLCPVGAITSKPYSSKSRPWELRLFETIDLTDSLGSNMYANFQEYDIVRFLPKSNSLLNGSLLSDKARFSYDMFNSQKLHDSILTHQEKNINVVKTEDLHKKFFYDIAKNTLTERSLFIIDDNVGADTLMMLKLASLNSKSSIRTVSTNANIIKNNYLNFQTDQITSLEINNNDFSQDVFIVGCDLKVECALLNLRLLDLNAKNLISIYALGCKFSQNYKLKVINLDILLSLKLFEGKLSSLSLLIVQFESPLFILGLSLQQRGFSISHLKHFIKKINPSSKVLGILLQNNSANSLYQNVKFLTSADIQKAHSIFLINCNDSILLRKFFKPYVSQKFCFWINTYPSKFFDKFKGYSIPFSSFQSYKDVYLNLENRPQVADYQIQQLKQEQLLIREVFKQIFLNNLIYSFDQYRSLSMSILDLCINNFKNFDSLISELKYQHKYKNLCDTYKYYTLKSYPIKSQTYDFYMFGWYTRQSDNLTKASKSIYLEDNNFF